MIKNITTGEMTFVFNVINTMDSDIFTFNLAMIKLSRQLEPHITDTQKAAEGLSEADRIEAFSSKIDIDFPIFEEEQLPKKLNMKQSLLLYKYMMNE